MPGRRSVTEAERLASAKLGGVPVHRERMASVAHIHRAASAVRRHLENSVLRCCDPTWTAFVVLWVVRVWGESETRHVAQEAGISRGTLTGGAHPGVAGAAGRAGHPADGRLVLPSLTEKGEDLMQRVVLRGAEHGQDGRRELLNGTEPAPRHCGRRPAKH